jgi:hypothetical protein
VYTFPYREHATERWLVSLRNTSRFDIRLTGLALPGGRDDGLIRILGLRLPADPSVISWSDTVPFRPITLRAGTELPVIVLLRIGNCRFNDHGGSASIDSLPIRYTLFGVLHRTEEFPAGSAVSVAAPRASACPER